MPERRRVLIVAPQPVQHEGPAMRALAARDDTELQVAYCSLPDEALHRSEEYITKKAFDGAPAHGYPWVAIDNRSPLPRLGRFAGLFNPGLVSLIRDGRWDAVVVYGYAYASCWLALVTARRAGAAVLLGSDATTLEPQAGGAWKVPLKRRALPRIYGLADVIIVPSGAAQRFVTGLGVRPERVVLTPYVVDNAGIAAAAAAADRPAVRAAWNVPAAAPLALFVGKFIARKRPQDLLHAFARAGVAEAHAVLVGAGPLEDELRGLAKHLGIAGRVRFPGLMRYADLPSAYAASDVVVVPSSHEPWGLPVNEAMVCGRPVIASDRVGAGADLVRHGETGMIYPVGDVPALAARLYALLSNPARARAQGEAAAARMASWAPADNARAVADAVTRAIDHRLARGVPARPLA